MTVPQKVKLARHGGDLDDNGHLPAEKVRYDPTTSGLTATDVQAAIDELAAGGVGPGPTTDEPVEVVAASGSAVTINYDVAHWYDITLTDDCTLTIINPPASALVGDLVVVLRQGGVGSFTVTWPASVQWDDGTGLPGGSAPTLNTAVGAQDVIELVTFDGGVTWGGSTGGGTTAAATTIWVPVMVEDGATGLWYVTVTGDGDAVMTEVPL